MGPRARAWREAELGEVGGKDGADAPGVRTDPRQAAAYVAATGVDALAAAVGSPHAMTTRTSKLDLELVRRLHTELRVPLVLHGSPGFPDGDVRAAVAEGIAKVNIGTALNIAYTAAVRHALDTPTGVDARTYLAAGRDAMTRTVSHLLTVLAS